MKERIILSASMLLFATPFCYASGYTLAVANHIIVIQVVIVIVLVVLGVYSLAKRAASTHSYGPGRLQGHSRRRGSVVGRAGRDFEEKAVEAQESQGGSKGRGAELLREDGCPCQ